MNTPRMLSYIMVAGILIYSLCGLGFLSWKLSLIAIVLLSVLSGWLAWKFLKKP